MSFTKQFKFLGLFLILSGIIASPVQAEENAKLISTMRANFEALMNLQPLVADSEAFRDPKNRTEIQKNLDSMSGLKHVFSEKIKNQEPGLAVISNLFSQYLQNIQTAFKSGASGSYLRNQIRTMTAFCLSCHTRVGTEKSFTDVTHKIKTSPLSAYQKAEFYAATRQFDEALNAFDQIISTTPEGELGLIEFGRAVRNILSITIRVKQDPKATFYFLEKISNRKDIPEYFQRYISEWKKDVMAWNKEPKLLKKATDSMLIAKASVLIEKAKKEQLFAVDPTGDVNYLRATNYIHEALQKNPQGKSRGEALYLLGHCYDALQDPLFWALDSLYFEACIREFPHSETSKKCYKRYATKLYFGYSGSGGTSVPDDEIQKLQELRKLSE